MKPTKKGPCRQPTLGLLTPARPPRQSLRLVARRPLPPPGLESVGGPLRCIRCARDTCHNGRVRYGASLDAVQLIAPVDPPRSPQLRPRQE